MTFQTRNQLTIVLVKFQDGDFSSAQTSKNIIRLDVIPIQGKTSVFVTNKLV